MVLLTIIFVSSREAAGDAVLSSYTSLSSPMATSAGCGIRNGTLGSGAIAGGGVIAHGIGMVGLTFVMAGCAGCIICGLGSGGAGGCTLGGGATSFSGI
eukprot:6402249-Ditylum_brightwellii.AAC.1